MESKEIELNPIPYKVTNVYHVHQTERNTKTNILLFTTGLLLGYLIGHLIPLRISLPA